MAYFRKTFIFRNNNDYIDINYPKKKYEGNTKR